MALRKLRQAEKNCTIDLYMTSKYVFLNSGSVTEPRRMKNAYLLSNELWLSLWSGFIVRLVAVVFL